MALKGAEEQRQAWVNKSKSIIGRWFKAVLKKVLPQKVLDTESQRVPEGAIACAIAGRPAKGGKMCKGDSHDYEADQSQADESDAAEGDTETNASFPDEESEK